MITVYLNKPDFEYDIHSLVKAFFVKEDVKAYPGHMDLTTIGMARKYNPFL